MDRTPSQVEADQNLHRALQDCAHAYEMLPDGAYLTDWTAVAAIETLNDQEIAPFVVLAGEQGWHVTVGLLRGAELLQHEAEGDE